MGKFRQFLLPLYVLILLSTGNHSIGSRISLESRSLIDKLSLWDMADGPHLRGANIIQMRVYPELDGTEFKGSGPVGPPFVQADFDRLAEFGANYVNISHPGLFTESPPYELDAGVQENLDNLLEMITRADLFAVITFRTGPGRNEFAIHPEEMGSWYPAHMLINTVWKNQAAQSAWREMWRHTAQRYRANPVVIGYDLMCEPNSNEYLDEWDPEEFYSRYGETLHDWNAMYPPIIDAIREVDTQTPILVGGMAYSAVEWLSYIETTSDQRTVYMFHQYAPIVYTHQRPSQNRTYPGEYDVDWDGEPDRFDRSWLDHLLHTVDDFASTHNVPSAVNEFGVNRWVPGGATFMRDLMELFEERGLNHALWVWAPSWEPYSTVIDDMNFRHGPDPNNHVDVSSSDLMDVILGFWNRNTLRPSTQKSKIKKSVIRR
jgi:hypothetical protein